MRSCPGSQSFPSGQNSSIPFLVISHSLLLVLSSSWFQFLLPGLLSIHLQPLVQKRNNWPLFFNLFFIFGGTWALEFKAVCLLGKLYHLSNTSNPFCCSYYSKKSHFLPRPAGPQSCYLWFPPLLGWYTWITTPSFFSGWDGVLLTFCPGYPWIVILLISALE
jgi:hypothetical protein